MSRITLFGKLTHSLLGVTALYGQFSGDSGRLHRSLRDHFVFMSASSGYPRFFKASSTPSISRSFSREGMTQTIIHLQRLSSNGVAFHSYTEPHLATDNELVRNILLALLSSLAKVEAQKISERTRAGMSRARAKGVKIGRPKLPAELRHEITQRAAKCETAYAIEFAACGLARRYQLKISE
jgi:Resolvase, N terminal domain